MARTPASNDAFFREVDEEVRRAAVARAARRYGLAAAIVVVLALAAFGGWLLWQNRQQRIAGENGEALTRAMVALGSGNVVDARKGVTQLEASGAKGYAPLARLLDADMAARANKPAEAAAAFLRISDDEATPRPVRDVALVRATALSFDTLPPAQVIARMRPLAVPGNAWFGSAGEMSALAMLRLGQAGAAGATLARLAADRQVPSTIRERAAQLAGSLGVQAVQPGDSAAS